MARFKAIGYEDYRNSENKIFTHATVYRNLSRDCVGVTFHINLKNAEADFRSMNKRSHLTCIEIVGVEQVGA